MLDLPATPGPSYNGGSLIIGPVNEGMLGNRYPVNLYFAYGIRNSFGIDFDPLTGNLWDTENGPDYGDEINLAEPGSNSGWDEVQGIWPGNYEEVPTKVSKTLLVPENLLDFGGESNYSLPELTWADTIGPTAIKFFKSDKLGKQYENDMFVGDIRLEISTTSNLMIIEKAYYLEVHLTTKSYIRT